MNMERRKDNKGKVLQKGESQRKDGTYMYRWNDLYGKRRTVYAKTINDLREKELEIEKAEKFSGVSTYESKTSILEFASMCKSIRKVKITTQKKRDWFLKVVERTGFGNLSLSDVKTSVAKRYLVSLNEEYGYHYGTVSAMKSFLHSIFQIAVEDDVLLKNPFEFRLEYLIYDDRKKRTALTPEQSRILLDAFYNDNWYRHSYEDVLILLNTGLRVSELYGLTFRDLDFKNGKIFINKQLHWIDGKYVLMSTKSKAGNRTLAMTDEVKMAFMRKAREPRPKTEYMIDGKSGFVFLNRAGVPKTRKNLSGTIRNIQSKHEELKDMPTITPHVLRHTFCTRMVEAKVDIKSLQLIMGHSDIGTTLNVYTHLDEDSVVQEMRKAMGN